MLCSTWTMSQPRFQPALLLCKCGYFLPLALQNIFSAHAAAPRQTMACPHAMHGSVAVDSLLSSPMQLSVKLSPLPALFMPPSQKTGRCCVDSEKLSRLPGGAGVRDSHRLHRRLRFRHRDVHGDGGVPSGRQHLRGGELRGLGRYAYRLRVVFFLCSSWRFRRSLNKND